MWYWALAFLLIAVVTAFLSFGTVALAIPAVGKLIFYGAVVMFLVTVIGGMMRPV